MSGGIERPAGARAEDSAAPAGFQGQDALGQWRKALAAHNAALRRKGRVRARRREGTRYRPGTARRPPPEPGGDDAA